MASVVFTGYKEGYIDYGVSHRQFQILDNGRIGGVIGLITDTYEIALIQANFVARRLGDLDEESCIE